MVMNKDVWHHPSGTCEVEGSEPIRVKGRVSPGQYTFRDIDGSEIW